MTRYAELRKHLGMKNGVVEVVETADGIPITPQHMISNKALGEIGAAPREHGLTLDDKSEPGRAIREALFQERHGSGCDGHPRRVFTDRSACFAAG